MIIDSVSARLHPSRFKSLCDEGYTHFNNIAPKNHINSSIIMKGDSDHLQDPKWFQSSLSISYEIHVAKEEEEKAADQLRGKVMPGDLIGVRLHGLFNKNAVSRSNKPFNRSEDEVLVRVYGTYY
ncbi:hypothetical protein PVL29_026227 [Vitis rotundifolia]|uniref:Uncharacterized protein n=1 Tax=Vitis rotundifolia TaxID=103349 RepID=A0AA38YM06_VITRO|nr:hypothetical protein PVL29_026227 [Vitis rotundifolia]